MFLKEAKDLDAEKESICLKTVKGLEGKSSRGLVSGKAENSLSSKGKKSKASGAGLARRRLVGDEVREVISRRALWAMVRGLGFLLSIMGGQLRVLIRAVMWINLCLKKPLGLPFGSEEGCTDGLVS